MLHLNLIESDTESHPFHNTEKQSTTHFSLFILLFIPIFSLVAMCMTMLIVWRDAVKAKKKNVLYAIGNDFVFYFLAFFAFTPRFEFRVWYDKMKNGKNNLFMEFPFNANDVQTNWKRKYDTFSFICMCFFFRLVLCLHVTFSRQLRFARAALYVSLSLNGVLSSSFLRKKGSEHLNEPIQYLLQYRFKRSLRNYYYYCYYIKKRFMANGAIGMQL